MRWRALAFAAAVGGCAQIDTGSQAMRALSEDLGCPESRVEMTQVGAYRYRGEGCGRASTVVCSASRLEPTCLAQRTAGGAVAQAADRDDPEEPRAVAPVAERRGEDDGATIAGADEEDGETPAIAETPDAEIETRIRGGLDARRDDILACTGRERVAVRAGYAPDGSVAFSLQGDLAGSPEEGCVADALDGVRVAATGEAGVVIHLVR